MRCLQQTLETGLGSAKLTQSACSLLRQLANSDAIKAAIVENKGFDLFCKAVDAHINHAGMYSHGWPLSAHVHGKMFALYVCQCTLQF